MTATVVGGPDAPQLRRVELAVSGMTCAACAARVENRLNKVDGVRASVNYATRVATVDAPEPLADDDLCEVVRRAGYQAEPRSRDTDDRPDPDDAVARSLMVRLAVAAVLFVPLAHLSVMFAVFPDTRFTGWQWVLTALALPIVTWAAWPFHRIALRNARHRTASMETLISVGITAATVWSIATIFGPRSGDTRETTGVWQALMGSDSIYLEVAAGVTVFVLAGRYFEARAKSKAGSALRALAALSAKSVSVLLPDDTEMIIPADELTLEPVKGKAMDRALAYLAHGESPHSICPLFGRVFGTVYDISTILILWFAGASAMAGLLNMVPRYLPRYGMAPEWAAAYRPLVLAFTAINLLVTWAFNADVSAQGGAYATGVLVLMTSAAIATLVDISHKPLPADGRGILGRRASLAYFFLVCLVFIYTTIANMIERPDGIIIASIFIGCVLVISLVSRFWRAEEMRLKEFRFVDDAARMLWTDICLDGTFQVLVPHRPGQRSLAEKEAEIRRRHRIPPGVPLVFLEVHYGDTSDFENAPIIGVRQEGERFVITAHDCVSVSHTIAQLAMEMTKNGSPLDIVFGWSKGNRLKLALDFLLFGRGDVPNRVVDLLDAAIADPDRRPTVIVG